MKKKSTRRKPVTQKHGTGCAVACVAFVLGRTYDQALKCFATPSHAWGRGYFCREVADALQSVGLRARWHRLRRTRERRNFRPGTIVYVGVSRRYPLGHYLVRTKQGDWMNPWVNFPVIAPAKSAFVRRLPGIACYRILPTD